MTTRFFEESTDYTKLELRPEDWVSPTAFPRVIDAGMSVVEACLLEAFELGHTLHHEWLVALYGVEAAKGPAASAPERISVVEAVPVRKAAARVRAQTAA